MVLLISLCVILFFGGEGSAQLYGKCPTCKYPCRCRGVDKICDGKTGRCEYGCEDYFGGKDCQTGNISRFKPATQSSTYGNLVASKAVDGIRSPWIHHHYGYESCSHTNEKRDYPPPWWKVYLQGRYLVYHVTVWTRSSYAHKRLRNFTVNVDNLLCGKYMGTIPVSSRGKVVCRPNTIGNTVKITNGVVHNGRYMALCEVIVYGRLNPL